MTYTVSKCLCGHVACRHWHVDDVANVQGVSFTEPQARAVAILLNHMENPPKRIPLHPTSKTQRALLNTGKILVRIWSDEWKGYWKLDGIRVLTRLRMWQGDWIGYTDNPFEAGIWPMSNVWHVTELIGPEKKLSFEIV